ncbi:MAG: hypothetical protein JJE18_04185 [Eubacteriaceae bacterium]|nr:hypothetical protein [Eubacteriaceae bacterium]
MYQINTIVHPEIEDQIKSKDANQTNNNVEIDSMSTKIHVANAVAILLSRTSENIKNQIIFIDKGEHLFQNWVGFGDQ